MEKGWRGHGGLEEGWRWVEDGLELWLMDGGVMVGGWWRDGEGSWRDCGGVVEGSWREESRMEGRGRGFARFDFFVCELLLQTPVYGYRPTSMLRCIAGCLIHF